MSRSRKKPWMWISKPWDKWKESSLRNQVRQACRRAEVEQDFDPDRDWEEFQATNKKCGEYGTRCGFDRPPAESEDEEIHQEYERLLRK